MFVVTAEEQKVCLLANQTASTDFSELDPYALSYKSSRRAISVFTVEVVFGANVWNDLIYVNLKWVWKLQEDFHEIRCFARVPFPESFLQRWWLQCWTLMTHSQNNKVAPTLKNTGIFLLLLHIMIVYTSKQVPPSKIWGCLICSQWYSSNNEMECMVIRLCP